MQSPYLPNGAAELNFPSNIKSILKNEEGEINSLESKKGTLDALKDELLLLNWLKQAVEVDEGLMFCEKCSRWYPIKEPVPHLVPDGLRVEAKDLAFMEKWKHLIDKRALTGGLPYHP